MTIKGSLQKSDNVAKLHFMTDSSPWSYAQCNQPIAGVFYELILSQPQL